MPRYFTQDHEWIDVDGDQATIGITAYAQQQLGDVVFVELPAPGQKLERGDDAAVVESVKAASDVYAPVAGIITDGNADLEADPALVNNDAEGAGWFFRMTLTNPAQLNELMDAAAYAAYLETL